MGDFPQYESRQGIDDIARFAEEAKRRMRRLRDSGPDLWRPIVEEGLREVYRRNDLTGLVSMVGLMVNLLDGAGRPNDAVIEIEHALSLARQEPNASSVLNAMKASFLVAQGEPERAIAAIQKAERAQAESSDVYARLKTGVECTAARAQMIGSLNIESVEDLIAAATRDYEGDALYLLSWFIPYLFAIGFKHRAHPWIRTLRLKAETQSHAWREADAVAFELGEKFANGVGPTSPEERTLPAESSWISTWRVQSLLLKDACRREDWPDAQRRLLRLRRAERASGLRLAAEGCFESLISTRSGEAGVLRGLEVPHPLHLLNLPAALAGGEAVAHSGTRAEAGKWFRWFDQTLPGHVQTSLEWPVSRARIQAMLAVRAGDTRTARKWFERSIDWADGAEYATEAALGRVQLAELVVHGGLPVREKVWSAWRHDGWEALRSQGVDATPHAYVIAQSVAEARGNVFVPRLSRRETEVLSLFAAGLTYKGSAERLGLRYATVQTLAHRAYEKLGVSGKMRAIEAARELGIL